MHMGHSRTCKQDGQTGREEAGRQTGTSLCQAEEVKVHTVTMEKQWGVGGGQSEMSFPLALSFSVIPKLRVCCQDLALAITHHS